MTSSDAPRIDRSRNPDAPFDKLTIGVCPDQWGVWFPEDEKQIPWRTALGEMAQAGFSVMETGPWGYFPQDAKQLQSAMDEHGFRVVAGTGWGILHKEGAWAETERTFRAIAETHAAVGAEYMVHLPPMYRDEKTWKFTDDRELTGDAWKRYVTNANELGRIMKEDYGLTMVLHPHGDSHIETARGDRAGLRGDGSGAGLVLPGHGPHRLRRRRSARDDRRVPRAHRLRAHQGLRPGSHP